MASQKYATLPQFRRGARSGLQRTYLGLVYRSYLGLAQGLFSVGLDVSYYGWFNFT